MDVDLDQYLKSEALQFYVFDYKEERMDEYVGKTRVPLLALVQDEGITGEASQTSCSSVTPAGQSVLCGVRNLLKLN